MRVVLVCPPPLAVVEPWYDRPSFGRHGLACLAGYLREQPGMDVRVVDAKLARLDFPELLERIVELEPDLVGLTAFTNEIKPAARVARMVKQALPNVTTVIGGVHVSALPEHTLREFDAFDVGVVGEGELALHELAEALRSGSALERVSGLVLRVGGEVRRTPPRPKIHDLDLLPLPAWDLFPRADEYWVMTSRGCPFTCRFCVNPNGRLPRQHSVERVMAEIRAVLDHRPRKLWFADEIFGIHRAHTERLLDAMIAENVGSRVSWWAESHVRFVDLDLFRRMKQAGCSECGLGIETGDADSLRQLGKGTNRQLISRAFSAARAAGIDSIGFFVLGHPDETLQSIRATIAFAVELNPEIPIFGVMVPYPGTEVARLAALGQGGYRLLTGDWDAYNKQVGGALAFAGLSRTQIELLQLWAYTKVFVANRRFSDLAAFVWSHRTAGLRVLQRALSRGARGAGPPPLDETTRRAIIEARADWSRSQTRSMHELREVVGAAPAGASGRTGVRLRALAG